MTWADKKKECHQRSVNQSNVGPHPSNRCQLVQRRASIFAWQLPKQQQITVDWERSLVAHRLWSGIGHFDRSHRQFHHVVCSTPVVKPESNFEELLAQTRPSTKYSLIKSALQGVVLHGNHVVLQVALHQVHPPIFQRGGMEMFYITNAHSQFVWNLKFVLFSLFRWHETGGSPAWNTSLYNHSNASKISRGTCFNSSAVNPTSSPPLSFFNLPIALMVQSGSENSTGGIGTSHRHRPLKSVANMQAKSFSWGRTIPMRPTRLGMKCCMAFHLQGIAKRPGQLFRFPLTHSFFEKCGFANSILSASVDPVFFTAVTASI